MSDFIFISINNATGNYPVTKDYHSVLEIKSSEPFVKIMKAILLLSSKITIKRICILVDESNCDYRYLKSLLLYLQKMFTHYERNIITNYVINNTYMIFKKEKLIKAMIVNPTLKSLQGFIHTGEFQDLSYHFSPASLTSGNITSKSNNPAKVILLAPLAWSPQIPPLGLAYIYSSLKKRGHSVDILDCNISFFTGDFLDDAEKSKFKYMPYWIDKNKFYQETFPVTVSFIEDACEKIKSSNYEIIGVTVHHSSELFTYELLKKLKNEMPNLKIILGGPSTHVLFLKKMMESNLADVAIKGEGEIAVIEAMEYLKGNTSANLQGCIINDNGVPKAMAELPLCDINTLELPDFSEFELFKYDNYILPTSLSRGCVAKCSFCFEQIYWKKFRIKRPEVIFSEIFELSTRYNIRSFAINDSLMNGSHKILSDFCDIIIKKKFKISFQGYCRIDKKLTLELFNKMKEAGCWEISFGIESGSQKVLDLMAKGVNKKYILPTLKGAYLNQIQVSCCFMVGYPGESLLDYLQTLSLIIRARKYITNINLSIFLPSHETKMMIDPQKFNLTSSEKGWVSSEFWNRPKILRLKYRLIQFLWHSYKKVKTSPEGWRYL